MMLVFFAVSALDVMDALDSIAKQRQSIIDWVYSQQILLSSENGKVAGGFRGGPINGHRLQGDGPHEDIHLDYSHIAMTYTALSTLLILGDDLARVDKAAIITGLKHMQRPDGSFAAMYGGSENDMRFLFCAAIISYILNDWSGVDVSSAVAYIRASHGYDFGIAQGPGQEPHGGSTFCAIAALSLMGKLNEGLVNQQRTLKWLLQRQETGFQGRPNKPVDTCYAFWVGASIAILDGYHLVDTDALRMYLCECQQPTGGFSKWPDTTADPLHAYFGLCGLSLLREPGMLPIHSALNMTSRSADRLRQTVFWQ